MSRRGRGAPRGPGRNARSITGRGGRGRARGRARGRGRAQVQARSKEELDKELDEYMADAEEKEEGEAGQQQGDDHKGSKDAQMGDSEKA